MRILYRFSIRHPFLVLLIAAVTTAAFIPGLPRLKLRTDGHALVPADAPEVLYDRSIRDQFGIRDLLAVLIQRDGPDGIFNTHTLALVRTLSEAFTTIPSVGPGDILSLATEHTDRVRPGTLIFQTFLENLPQTPEELARLRSDLREIAIYTGTLVSADGSATAIFIGVPPGVNRNAFCNSVQSILDAQGNVPERFGITGAPIGESSLGTHIMADLGVPAAWLGKHEGDAGRPAAGRLDAVRAFLGQRIGLLPIAIGVMFAVFLILFRSPMAAMLPLAEVGACLVFVFGLMGWLGIPIYLTIAVLPVVLTAAGVADEIHLFSRYTQILRAEPDTDHRQVLLATLDEMTTPIVKTTITTAVGFASFIFSPLEPVRVFGWLTSAGMAFCMLWSFSVIPASLALLDPKRLVRRRPRSRPTGTGAVPVTNPKSKIQNPKSPGWSRPRAALITTACLLLVLLTPLAIRRVAIQDSWIDNFATGSAFHATTLEFNRLFDGMHVLQVCADAPGPRLSGEIDERDVSTQDLTIPAAGAPDPSSLVGCWIKVEHVNPPPKPPPGAPDYLPAEFPSRIAAAQREGDRIRIIPRKGDGPPRFRLRLAGGERLQYEITARHLMRPEFITALDGLERFIAGRQSDAVGGVLGPATYLATTNWMSRARNVGERRIMPDADQLEWLWGWYGRIRGPERLRQTVSADYSRGLITVFMKNANFVDTARLLEAIRAYEREHLAPLNIRLGFAGDVAVSQTLIDAIVSTEVISVIFSIVGTLVVTILLSRSLVWGLACAVPSALAVPVTFAVMGIAGIPLGVATSMCAGMTLGIGVDFAIHLVDRYRHSRREGMTSDAALADAIHIAGPAIVANSLGVSFGFGILMLSQVPANARLGLLFVVSMTSCLVFTLLLLPALIRLCRPRMDSVSRPEADAPLEPVTEHTS